MSVTLKLADDDAKLIGFILGEVGKAAIEARSVKSELVEASREAAKTSTIGHRVATALSHKAFATPEELIRLGFAFDTAWIANEPKHR